LVEEQPIIFERIRVPLYDKLASVHSGVCQDNYFVDITGEAINSSAIQSTLFPVNSPVFYTCFPTFIGDASYFNGMYPILSSFSIYGKHVMDEILRLVPRFEPGYSEGEFLHLCRPGCECKSAHWDECLAESFTPRRDNPYMLPSNLSDLF